MPSPIVTLPLDLTGLNAVNKITNEEHILVNSSYRMIVPIFGAFFKEGLIVTDNETLLTLTEDQYVCMDLYQNASLRAGKEVFNTIIITDGTVNQSVSITYQALGGEFCRDRAGLIAWLEERKVNTDTLSWDIVTDKPKQYPPSAHHHLMAHVYGMEYLVAGAKRVEDAINIGSSETYSRIVDALDDKLEASRVNAHQQTDAAIAARLQWFSGTSNKEGIKLGLLNNFARMNKAIGAAIAKPNFDPASLDQDYYSTILGLDGFNEELQEQLVSRLTTHIGDNAPTYVDPVRSNLISLPIGGVVTLPTMKSVTDDDREIDMFVYPDDISEGDEFVVTKLNGNENNPGGVFLSFNKRTSDTYIGLLRGAGCAEKFSWNKLVFEGELSELTKLMNDHINDTKNPHNLDKDDVDLGKVENLEVVSEDELINKKSVRKYLTLDTLMYFMKAFLTNAKPPPPPGQTLDPNAHTMDQCQIIFSNCKKEPPPQVWPGRDQLVKTFCDGNDKFGKFTDGNGGTYDKVIELNSDDCGYRKYPDLGTLLSTYCSNESGGDGEEVPSGNAFTRMGRYADGLGGTYNEVIKINDPDCGYKPYPPDGTIIAVFCSGVDKMTRYADGLGGTYDMPSELWSPDCMSEAPPTETPTPTPSFVPAGTVLSHFCQGFSYYARIADGNGGITESLVGNNHASCGYLATMPTGTTPGTTPGNTPGTTPTTTNGPSYNRVINLSASKKTINSGDIEWLSASLSGYEPNSNVEVVFYFTKNGVEQVLGSQIVTVGTTGSKIASINLASSYFASSGSGSWPVVAKTHLSVITVVSNSLTMTVNG